MKSPIQRPKYFSKVKTYLGKPIIKVIIGQRRVGKSYLLHQVAQYIKDEKLGSTIYIDKEDERFFHITDAPSLTDHIKEEADKLGDGRKFVLIDEIQEIAGFEDAVRAFAAKDDFELVITGSNSQMLSGELATKLSGRYVEILVNSLDFTEFCTFHSMKNDTAALDAMLRYGGMPFLRFLELNEQQAYEYLNTVSSNIIYRDIVGRYNIRNINFLDRLIHFLADNIGNILNAKRIVDYLKAHRVNISVNTVLDYLSFITSSHLIIPVKRIDLRGKKIFDVGEKYYFQDIGIRNAIVGYRVADRGQILENVVCHHMVSNGYELFTGDWQDKEIDFVAIKNNEKLYVQVAYMLANEETVKREFGNLLAINDNFRKIVVTMDQSSPSTYQGIEHMHLLDFLQVVK